MRVRSGAWRLLVPMRHVERVHGAALPAACPTAGDPATPVVAIAGELVPVVFVAALLGATEVSISPEHQMLLVSTGGRRALLWVDAAEELVADDPVPAPAGAAAPGGLVAGWSGAERPLAVLDVPRLLELIP